MVDKTERSGSAMYGISDNQHLALAYYRNTIIHFFVNSAIAEVTLIHIVTAGHTGQLRRAILNEAMRLRDVLKFEFFLSPATDLFDRGDTQRASPAMIPT